MKYIDLHNHILPAIDDGPRTMEQSVDLARALVSAGFEQVVATPHTFEGKPAPSVIFKRLNRLQNELDQRSIALKVLPGAEQHIEPYTLELLRAGKILTLNNTRYLLLELPMFQPLPAYTEQVIYSLIAEGYLPVIPHPERTVDLQNDYNLICRLHEAGAIYQVTWGALTGLLGPAVRKTARAMLDANLCHLFSTDAHDADSPLLGINKAAAFLESRLGPGAAENFLITRPKALLADQEFDLPAAKKMAANGKRRPPMFSMFRRTMGH